MNSMLDKSYEQLKVYSSLGRMSIDCSGATISGVRMEVEKSYDQIPTLLQRFIDSNDCGAWDKIKNKIDYIYSNIDYALTKLNFETNFGNRIISDIEKGKKILFKPNLVSPDAIDYVTHGEGAGNKICTEWPLIAAIMRWLHDKLNISYYDMSIGEASTSTFMLAYLYNKVTNKNITTEAIIEGKCKDFYGGWGFYFVRKYLAENHPSSHEDNPMNGYEDSIEGRYFPPGKASNRLLVYDLNKVQEDINRGRTVKVPDGKNFDEITLHKVVVGGDPANIDDISEYPGCILVNVPKLKMHAQDLLTNAIKNLGIGLYPGQCASTKNINNKKWKYAYPNTEIPTYKGKLPHSPWVLEVDEETFLPIKDENGNYKSKKTYGFSGTQGDVIRAVQCQNVFIMHIVDAINMINISHNPDGKARRIPEGYVFASLDCVALDLFCARYCHNNVPMIESLRYKQRYGWNTEFVRNVPVAVKNGKNIVTKMGLDSPLFRYNLYNDLEEQGVGQQKYYVVGWDSMTNAPLASLKGHLGRIEDNKFFELLTQTMYYNPLTILHDLQKTILSYLEACDNMTGSTIYNEFMDCFDENKDGIIDYDEKGRGIETAIFPILAHASDIYLNEEYGKLKSSFIQGTFFLKNSNKNWNSEGHDFTLEKILVAKVAEAYKMSQSETVCEDYYISGMYFGKGMWPSWNTVTYNAITNSIYGSQSLNNISFDSIYGSAFQYADKTLNEGIYTGSIDQMTSDKDSINMYFEEIANGREPLGFTLYVPIGYGKLEDIDIPNVKETNNSKKIFTVYFEQIWG